MFLYTYDVMYVTVGTGKTIKILYVILQTMWFIKIFLKHTPWGNAHKIRVTAKGDSLVVLKQGIITAFLIFRIRFCYVVDSKQLFKDSIFTHSETLVFIVINYVR